MMIDGCNKIYSQYVVARQLILIDESAVVNVLLKLSDQPLIDAPINAPAGPSHVPIPAPKGVFHERAKHFCNAEVWDVQE
jgi:hypothetical protein